MKVSKSKIKKLIQESFLEVYTQGIKTVNEAAMMSIPEKEIYNKGMAGAFVKEVPGNWKLDNRQVFYPRPYEYSGILL